MSVQKNKPTVFVAPKDESIYVNCLKQSQMLEFVSHKEDKGLIGKIKGFLTTVPQYTVHLGSDIDKILENPQSNVIEMDGAGVATLAFEGEDGRVSDGVNVFLMAKDESQHDNLGPYVSACSPRQIAEGIKEYGITYFGEACQTGSEEAVEAVLPPKA